MRISPSALSAGAHGLLAASLGGMLLHFYCMPPSAICSVTPAAGSIFPVMGAVHFCPWIFSAVAALGLIGIGSTRLRKDPRDC